MPLRGLASRLLSRRRILGGVAVAAGFPGTEETGSMFQFKQEFEGAYCGARPLEATRALDPELQGFDEWARGNASRIPVE